MTTRRYIPWVLAFSIVGLFTLAWQARASYAQTQVESTWSTPQQIPDYFDLLNAPLLAADSEGTVHAFDLESDGDSGFGIFYRTWKPEQGWSAPVVVLLPPYLGIAPSLQDVVLDSRGSFHLIYYGGTNQSGIISYTTALASVAGQAPAWSEPVDIADDAGPLESAQIVDVGNGRLVMIYSGNRYGIGLYEIHSLDNGGTWSSPVVIYRSTSADLYPGEIRTARVPGQGVDIVWHMVNTGGQAAETWYGHLSEDLTSWGQVQALSKRKSDQDFNGYPTIIALKSQLLVVYYDDFPPTRFMRRSTDNGKSWTLPVKLFPFRGGYGQAAMVKDSAGVAHMILGNRIQDPEIHGMWYSTWNGISWSALTPIISGPSTSTFDPTLPKAVVVQGNILLAAWSNNVRVEGRTGAWYSYRLLDAPRVSAKPLPLPSPTQTVAPVNTATAIPTSTPVPTLAPIPQNMRTEPQGPFSGSPVGLILLGIAPIILILIGFLLRFLNNRV